MAAEVELLSGFAGFSLWWLLSCGRELQVWDIVPRISEESRRVCEMELLCKGKDELLSTNVYIHVLSTPCTPPHRLAPDTQNEHAHATCSHHVRTQKGKTCTWKCSHTVYSTHTYTPHTCSQDILSHMYTYTHILLKPWPHGYMDSGICKVGGGCHPCVPLNTQEGSLCLRA